LVGKSSLGKGSARSGEVKDCEAGFESVAAVVLLAVPASVERSRRIANGKNDEMVRIPLELGSAVFSLLLSFVVCSISLKLWSLSQHSTLSSISLLLKIQVQEKSKRTKTT